MRQRVSLFLVLTTAILVALAASCSFAQESSAEPAELAEPPSNDDAEEGEAVATGPVEVEPVARDQQIAQRLTEILQSTEWFDTPEVTVKSGVVFLRGQTDRTQYKEWATQLAQRTQDVAAVVNRIEVRQGPIWDFQPAFTQLESLWRGTVQMLPLIVVGLLILAVSVVAARLISSLSRHLLRRTVTNQLLRDVAAKAIAIPVFLIGLYIVLHVGGLTRLALTVLGGTGLAGLVIGIAFRDIAENFLASLLISVQNPFQTGDLIKVNEHLGLVQKVTTRGTLLMAFDGTFIQIPNSVIYKNVILNYTANAATRQDFTIGIGYDAAIAKAQDVALAALQTHPAVLAEPESMVLVESLGAATVNLRVYFWIDSTRHGPPRVLSSVIRLVKRAFVDEGISLPDEAREVVFPDGVPIRQLGDDSQPTPSPPPVRQKLPVDNEPEVVSTAAEGDLRSETEEIEAQARTARQPEQGTDLLAPRDEGRTDAS